MYPPSHVAFAYLVGRKSVPTPVTGADVWWLTFFALLPDLFDKSIHYYCGFFASGRNIFHNIFIVLISYGIYRLLGRKKWKRPALIAFLGLATHFAGDLLQSLIKWTYTDFSSVPDWYLYMLFPIFDPPLLPIRIDWFGVGWELVFILWVVGLWIRDGGPGLFLWQSEGSKRRMKSIQKTEGKEG